MALRPGSCHHSVAIEGGCTNEAGVDPTASHLPFNRDAERFRGHRIDSEEGEVGWKNMVRPTINLHV